jgi:hypothetical protein
MPNVPPQQQHVKMFRDVKALLEYPLSLPFEGVCGPGPGDPFYSHIKALPFKYQMLCCSKYIRRRQYRRWQDPAMA